MGAALAFDNSCRPVVGIHPDFESASPIDCLRDGEQWACDSFVEFVKQEKDGQELYDMLLSNSPGMTLSSLREVWSKAVLKGEW
ncbi:hypothetical protein [Vreelandella populi]|uniref:Uncharacterized protein n=1 Tax=Vreelandella populi TaxID=2498858 RepID=A0A433LG96_9GAMM|nr:hypothetical protein [Halomonas populi]RUR48835.1 hypothetical protein ELY37_03005 [Halomonas populi]